MMSFKIKSNVLATQSWLRQFLSNKVLHLVNCILPAIFLGILVRATFVQYSNVPYWDEWDSRIMMNPKLENLDVKTFWQQHNEHRIILSKILFYFDFKFFNGNSAPLIVAGLLIVTATYCLFLFYIWRLSSIRNISRYIAGSLSALMGILLFSTMQGENFYWAFQSQFFLAVLFPLLAITLAYKYIQTKENKFFTLSWISSFLSFSSLASGLLVSLCLLFMYIVARSKKIAIGISAGLALFQYIIYFTNYKSTNSSPLTVFTNHPDFVLKYVALYLGAPFSYMINVVNKPLIVFAAITYVSIILVTVMKIKKYRKTSLEPALVPLMMAIYVLGTAALSAGGRYEFGVAQATAPRYTTMSLAGWCCVVLIAAELFKTRNYRVIFFTVSLVFLLLLPQQARDLKINDNRNFERRISALALELDINDQTQIYNIYPDSNRALELSKVLKVNRQSIFGTSDIAMAGGIMESRIDITILPKCVGYLDALAPVSGSVNQKQASGWIFQPYSQIVPSVVLSVDKAGQVTGYGFSGMLRQDVAIATSDRALMSGFKLYTEQNEISAIVGFESLPVCIVNIKS